MIAPRYRRPANRLKPDAVATLVAMRDSGSTWMEIGRVFGKQDCACRAIYQRAKRAEAPRIPPHRAGAATP